MYRVGDNIENMNQEDVENMQKQAHAVTKLIVGTFETELGQRCIKHLKKIYVDREIYKTGATLDMVAYRQGQCDLVRQIMKELNYDR